MVKRPAVNKGYRIIWLALAIVAGLFVSTLFSNAAANTARRKASCEARQQVYDGQFVMVRYLATQFRVSAAQKAEAVEALKVEVGERPVC